MNCGGDHAANFKKCPTKLSAIRRTQLFVTGKSAAPALRSQANRRQPPLASGSLWSSADFPTLSPAVTSPRIHEDHSYAGVVGNNQAPLTKPHTVEELAIQQRKELACMQQKHEAQLRSLVEEERRNTLLRDHLATKKEGCQAIVASLQ